MPIPPSGLLAASRRSWVTFWSSDLASVVVPAIDLPALNRLWMLYDERARMWRVLRKDRMVVGSMGQPRPNPLYARMASIDAAIERAEDRFGMSPKARQALGVSVRDTINDFNAAFEDDDTDEDGPDYRAVTVMDGSGG